ncbi:hypothetical protein EW026_g2860 [Hermanssonia centrifuga]|nr:hypothetical protein EW026_g2860 [Hermanssonia centrifuga]
MDSKLSSSIDLEEAEIDTPPLMFSAPGSPSPSISSLSSLSSPEATPPPTTPTERPLTRRQRKKLGLPAPRTALVASTRASAGKIVIPGGRMKRGSGVGVAGEKGEDSEEWQKNGTGRVDVRGFRELKI